MMHVRDLIREQITLRDGRKVRLRPIRASDAPALIELHSRLSPDSRYLRFFGPKPALSTDEADYLARVDFDKRFAIVATLREQRVERVVAVARFDIIEASTAEAAVVVRDDYQGVGLGTALLERLVDVARGRGVAEFVGEVLAENDRMLGLLRRHGLSIGPPEDAVVKVVSPITETPFVLKALRIVARTLRR